MIMKTALIFTMLAVGFAATRPQTETESWDTPITVPSDTQQSLKFIGTVEGKSFYTKDIRLGWAQSLDFCHSNGMKLASVTSVAQRNLLSTYLQTGNLTNISYFYMCGTDHLVEGEWRWNIVGPLITYAPWCSGHPISGGIGWNCHAMNSAGCWQNQNCGDSEPHKYVIGPLCEI